MVLELKKGLRFLVKKKKNQNSRFKSNKKHFKLID